MTDHLTRQKPITYIYEVDGHRIEVTRRHTGTAYARNGNTHNPTQYYCWESKLDGESVIHYCSRRSDAYEYARAKLLGIDYHYSEQPGRSKNVRNFRLVQNEMKSNYKGRV